MKKLMSVILAFMFVLGTAVCAFAGTSDITPESCTVYVTIVDKGEFAMTAKPIGVIDIDNDNALTVNDALYCAHEAYFEGGAAAGYGYATTSYGLSLTKLWGQTNNGGFGYCLDNTMCRSLADAVKDGANLVAFLYKDTTYWSDTFTFFDNPIVNEDEGSVELTLNGYTYDAEWNLVAAPIANATVEANFDDTVTFTTDENGKVTVPAKAGAYYSMVPAEGQNAVPALCCIPSEAAETAVESYTPATCTAAGSATVNGNTIAIPAKGHVKSEAVTENETKATCTQDGSGDTVVYCSVCGEEISRETATVPAKGHTASEAVKENEAASGYNKAGSYDSVVYCSVCGEEISRETVEIPAKTGFIEAVRYYFAKFISAIKTVFSSITSLVK